MKISVNWDACEGNGLCMAAAPTVFELDDDDQLHVLNDEPTDELREQVLQAERSCPKVALKVQG